jgi:Spy/CpxP family protein refolding chaperone
MTRKPTRLILTLALAVLPLAPLSAAGGPPHGRPFGGDGAFFDDERMERRAAHQAERLTRALDLTPEQQVTLGRLQDELEAAVDPLADGMRAAHRQLRTLLDAESPDPAAVGTQAIAIDRARDAMRAAWEQFETDFSAILTDTQRAIYRALQETRPERGPFAGPGGHGGHGGYGGPGGPPAEN